MDSCPELVSKRNEVGQRQPPPHGWHTLDIECKGVLSTVVDRMLARNRVGVGLTWSTISPLLPVSFLVKEASK